MRIKLSILLLLFAILTLPVFSQTNTLKTVKRKKKVPPITQEFSLGARLNTDGWGVFAERGFINPYENKTQFIWFGLSEKKHVKESKQLNESFAIQFPGTPAPLPFKYGKINNFYQMQFGYGQKKVLTGRLDKKSVIISWIYGAGLSIGFIKPYHLEVLVPEGNNNYSRQTIDFYDGKQDLFLDMDENSPLPTSIVGGTYFTEGIGNLSITPGVLAKSGFYFDYSPYRKSLIGMEIGTSLELYTKTIPLMATTNNNFYFLNLYLDVRFGKRWSRGN